MNRDNIGANSQEVIDSEQWLRDRIEETIAGPDPLQALGYVTRLLSATDETDTKLYCYRVLGTLTFRAGDIDRAKEAFEEARELSPEEPGVAYALAHCGAARSRWWQALLRALEAFHFADDLVDEAEFIRVAALAMREIGHPDGALAMLLGALDRAPRNPWILETIGHFYESEQMWLEAIGARDTLIDVLSDGMTPCSEQRPETLETPQFYRVFQAFAIKYEIEPEAIKARRREITDRLRDEIGPASQPTDAETDDAPLAPLELPRGLSTLVEQLATHDRNYRLLETAQGLWAKARQDEFDVQLTPNTLAAAIQWTVERRHWRITTPIHVLSQIYQVVPETIRAAARLVVGRFDVAFLPLQEETPTLGPREWEHLEQVHKAILYGAPLEDVQPGRSMLGE